MHDNLFKELLQKIDTVFTESTIWFNGQCEDIPDQQANVLMQYLRARPWIEDLTLENVKINAETRSNINEILIKNKGISEKYRMGYAFQYGNARTAINLKSAEENYRIAARAGHAIAQNNLGALCEARNDFAEALSWYRKAAQGGLAIAQCNIGLMLRYGIVNADGVPNFDAAKLWLQKAASQENFTAIRALKEIEEKEKKISNSRAPSTS